MIIVVTNIDADAKKDTSKGPIDVVRIEGTKTWDDSEWSKEIPAWLPMAEEAKRMEIGKTYEIKFEGKYKNVASIEEVADGGTSSAAGGSGPSQDEFRRSKFEMRRCEAISTAALIAGAVAAKTKAPQSVLEDALALAPAIEAYLAGEDAKDEVEDAIDGLDG